MQVSFIFFLFQIRLRRYDAVRVWRYWKHQIIVKNMDANLYKIKSKKNVFQLQLN